MKSSLCLLFILQVIGLQQKPYRQVLESIQNDPDHLALMLFIKDDCAKSQSVIQLLEEFTQLTYDILNIQIVNCDTLSDEELIHVPACQHKETLPFAMYLIPPKETNLQSAAQPTQKLLINFSLQSLKDGFNENSPQFWETINTDEEYEEFMKDNRLNKVITKLHKPIWWYGITQHFRDRLDFAIVNPRLIEKDLIIMKSIDGKYVEQPYNGAKQYESLRSYLSTIASTQRITRNIKSSKIEHQIKSISAVDQIVFKNQWVLVSINNHPRTQSIIDDMKGVFDVYQIENHSSSQLLIYPFTHQKSSIQITNQNPLQLCIQMMDYLSFNINNDAYFLLQDIQSLITTKKIVLIWFLNEKNMNKCHQMWAHTFANTPLYKNQFKFHIIYDPEEQIRKQFHVQKLPSICSLYINDGQVIQVDFDGIFDFKTIEDYVDKLNQRYQIEHKQSVQKPINQKEFEFLCSQQVVCVIGLIDKNNKVDEDVFIKAMKTVNNNKQIWIILYKDCQNLLLSRFNFKPPTVLLYNQNEYEYFIMKDQFTFKNIEKVAKANKLKWKELDFEITIQKCSIKEEL